MPVNPAKIDYSGGFPIGFEEEFSGLIRQHWSIENGCHWVLDTLYREDHSQIRGENAVKNFAILRRVAHNLLKAETSIKKSLPMKQMRAMAMRAIAINYSP